MKKTKIDIISGFLGSGKTTFIKKLMEGAFPDETIVILENEFGRVNIDGQTLGRAGLTVKSIQAGCICCSSSFELPTGIGEVIKEINPDRIMVEPTGVAKLTSLKEIFLSGALFETCEIDHIVTVVDAKNYFKRTLISKEFFEDQIRASEVIFLSKIDDISEEKIHTIIAEIYKVNPTCSIISESWDNIPLTHFKQLMMPVKENILNKQQPRLRINHKNDFESYEYVRDDYVSIEHIKLLIYEIENNTYGEIHRLKGICTDIHQGLYSVEYVPGETVIKILEKYNSHAEKSLICIIGRNLKRDNLHQFLCDI